MQKNVCSSCLFFFVFLSFCFVTEANAAFAKMSSAGSRGQSKNWFLPENSLHLQSPGPTNAMTKEVFDGIIKQATDRFCPVFESYSVRCDVSADWESTIVNAYAMRSTGEWTIGLQRRGRLITSLPMPVCRKFGARSVR